MLFKSYLRQAVPAYTGAFVFFVISLTLRDRKITKLGYNRSSYQATLRCIRDRRYISFPLFARRSACF